MITREKFDEIWSDEELQQMGVTREEWYKVYLEEEAYTNAWSDRVRYTLN